MAYQPISTVRDLGIRSFSQMKLDKLKIQADELALQDRMDAKTGTKLYSQLNDKLYALENKTMDYGFLDNTGRMNVTSLKEEGVKYNDETRKTLLNEYRVKFEQAGIPFNITAFDESWQKGKVRENRRIINDLASAKARGVIEEDDFDKALNIPEFRDFYLNMRDENNRAALTAAGYDPLYRTNEQRVLAAKEKFAKLFDVKRQAENLGLFAMEHPLGATGIGAGTIGAGYGISKMFKGGEKLKSAEQTLKTAQSAWAAKGTKPTIIKRPLKKNFKGGKTSKAYKTANKKYLARNKAIDVFNANKENLRTSLDDAQTAVDKIKSRRGYRFRKGIKSTVKGAAPYFAPQAGEMIGREFGGEEGKLAGQAAGTGVLTFLKRKLPMAAAKLSSRIATGHTAGIAGGPWGQAVAVLADIGFTGYQIYDLWKDYNEYLKTGRSE